MSEKLVSDVSIDGIRNIMISRLDLDMNPDEINPNDSLLEDLGLDSVDLLEVAIGIERIYKIRITQEDAEAFVSLQTLFDFCSQRQRSEATSAV